MQEATDRGENVIYDPRIEARRGFMKQSAVIAATSIISAFSAREAMGAVDLNRMKPEEALEALPDRFRLSNGEFVEGTKYPVNNPTQCAIILQTMHFENHELEPLLHNLVVRNRAETGEMIVKLHEEFGIDHFMQEGFTIEEETVKRIMEKRKRGEKVTADDIAEIRKALATIKYYREQRKKPFDANDEPRRIENMLKRYLPIGIYEKINNGELDIEVLAAEKTSTLYAAIEDSNDGDKLNDQRTVLLNREQANLDIAHTRREDFSAFGDIWAPGHWNLEGAPIPRTFHFRNQGNRGGKYCSIIYKMPAVAERDRLVKEGKLDLRF